ncbi:uncharacterized protein PHACADRAFT_158417 [Phanerochaete carnosa HHB-10118-sp]|uniref:O-acetylhomoserine (Thiol)-lyase n=1 Tax=Phanerochaete carnosa (strain HHB-10118-sp) TaxID=650164 RepID=K5XAQ7_PHACS|nr:uncharacterized protein PHACADRAFT_158417 [Phanerochaete carnosa HHB-10118-sp]EKM60017.1 hypothetical protein PHACADRAFT_158417 [Phanerochaete carnosa HHB-10118-sp]
MTDKPYKQPEFETLHLHASQDVGPTTNALPNSIYATTGFTFNDAQHAADFFSLKAFGNIYSRIGNSTFDVFEKRTAALEGGISALATSPGRATQFMAIAIIAGAGDNIVSSSNLYGGMLCQLDPEDFRAAIDENTKAIFFESMGNPTYIVVDISALAQVAHSNGIPLIVDNTFGIGVCGHGTTIAGVIVDSGKFDWSRSGKFPSFTKLSEGYHGFKFWDAFGPATFVVKVLVEVQRDLGATMGPFTAFLLLQGPETMSPRAERHCANALALARFLERHSKVSRAMYVGLPSHPSHALANRFFREGQYMGGRENIAVGSRVFDALKLASNLANVGGAKTLVIHPATTTHQQLNEEELNWRMLNASKSESN